MLGSLSWLMQRRGFDPPLRIFLVEEIFPLELTWVLTPFPKKLLDEYKPRSSLCTHAFHHIDSWQSCPRWVNTNNKNTQHAPSTKTKCDYLNGWMKKWSHIEGSQPEWCISSMIYSRDKPFWLEILDMQKLTPK